jgi:hypothetical protein
MGLGFIQMKRTQETIELMKDKNAFILLAQIAYRAKRTSSFSIHGLTIGEAMVGDFENIGLKRGEYREALKRLVNHQLITIETSNRGTIAKLINSDIFDINQEKADHSEYFSATNTQPSNDHRGTTNNNENNVKKSNNNKSLKKISDNGGKNEQNIRNNKRKGENGSKYVGLGKELLTTTGNRRGNS